MGLKEEFQQVNTYIVQNIIHLPTAYLLEEYKDIHQLWVGLKITPEMEAILKEVRERTISTDAVIKLNEIISVFNETEKLTEINSKFKTSIIKIIEDAKKVIEVDSVKPYKLNIEHDYDPISTYVEITIEDDNEIEIKTDIDFSPYWGVLETEKWEEIDDLFEGVFLGEEEFMQQFRYAFILQSYMAFYNVLEELKLFEKNNKVLPSGTIITLGQHDCHEFEFVVR